MYLKILYQDPHREIISIRNVETRLKLEVIPPGSCTNQKDFCKSKSVSLESVFLLREVVFRIQALKIKSTPSC
jgi:hypothetical protein